MRDFLRKRPAALVALLIAILLSISGLAVAQQGAAEEPADTGSAEETGSLPEVPAEATDGEGDDGAPDPGPPWTRDGAGDWSPGTAGPPQWAGTEDGDPPPMLTNPDWTPGEIPPWAGVEEGDGGPPFVGSAEGWTPSSGEAPPWAGGKPSWAGQDGEDEVEAEG